MDMMDNRILGESQVNRVLGMVESDAIAVLQQDNKILRVINRDGEALMVTADVRANRVNVYVKNGVVSRLENMG